MPFKGLVNPQDKNTIHLSTNPKIKLAYTSPNASDNVDLIINDSRSRKPFILEGEGAENYELDENYLPPVQGKILQRPVNIRFFPLYKTYDGSTTLRYPLLYQFEGTGDKESGIVEGTGNTRELRKTTITVNRYSSAFSCNALESESDVSYTVDIPIYDSLYSLEPHYMTINRDNYRPGSYGWFKMSGYTKLNWLDSSRFEGGNLQASVSSSYDCDSSHFYIDKQLHSYASLVYDLANTMPGPIKGTPTQPLNVRIQLDISLGRYETPDKSIATTSGGIENDVNTNPSDADKVRFSAKEIKIPSKDVTGELTPLIFTDPKLIGGRTGDKSANYVINDIINAYCFIIPKRIGIYILPKSTKVYDGTDNIEYETQLNDIVSGDSVDIPQDCRPLIRTESSKVGKWRVHENELCQLTGKDAKNYQLDWMTLCKKDDNNELVSIGGTTKVVTITKRPVWCKCSEIRFLRSQHRLQFLLKLENVIDGDDVNISSEGYTNYLDWISNNEAYIGVDIDTDYEVDSWSVNYDACNIPFSMLDDGSDVTLQINAYDKDIMYEITTQIRNGELWYSIPLQLIGKDANNYKLETTVLENIPVKIIDTH